MRRSVKTTYRKAGSSPGSRQKRSQRPTEAVTRESRLSPLARYIIENEDSGLSLQELREQFQDFECEHKEQYVVAQTIEKVTIACPDCALLSTLYKPGMK